MKKELPLVPSSNEVGFEARKVVRNCTSASLGTTDRDEGYAYTSFCSIAVTMAGEIVFLWSDLADHTQNIQHNDRVSVLCEQASHRTNPQAGARVTLVGRVEKSDDPELRKQFLAKHPSAKMYADFPDFNFYRFTLEKAHSVGGFGKAVWVEKDHFLCDATTVSEFNAKQDDVLAAMIDFDADIANQLVVTHLKKDVDSAEIARVDPDGVDLRYQGKNIRLNFEEEQLCVEGVLKQVQSFLS